MRYNWNKDNKLTPTEKGALTRKLKQEREFKREYDKMTKFIDEHPYYVICTRCKLHPFHKALRQRST